MELIGNLVVGIIRGTHGISGNLKVESTSGESEHFFDLTEVTLRKDGIEKTVKVESVKEIASYLLIKIAGIDTPEAAAKYKGYEIVVPRDKACPLSEGEFYVEALKKCALVYDVKSEPDVIADGLHFEEDPALIVAGIVTDVLEGGAGNLLEVEVSESLCGAINGTDKNGNKRIVLVPFKEEFIGTVDIKRKSIQLMHLWILE